MSGRGPLLRRFRSWVPEDETREELEFHRQCTVEELMARGMDEAEARAEAARRFGDVRRYERELAGLHRHPGAGERARRIIATISYALRRIRRSPGLSLAVIGTFAIGIGANATMFGIVDRIMLSPPLHVADHEEVHRVGVTRYVSWLGTTSRSEVLAYPDVEDLRNAGSAAAVAGFTSREMTYGRGETAHPVRALLADHELFGLLRTQPYAGRFFAPEEDRAGADGVVVLGHGFWRSQFGGDPDVLGTTIDLGHGPLTVIGIAPPGFTGVNLERVDLIVPLVATVAATGEVESLTSRNWIWVYAAIRRAPGISAAAVEGEATALHRAGRAEEAAEGGYDAEARVTLAPLIAARGEEVGSEATVALWLAGISLIVLLIACANIANLLLARAVQQRREISIRLALGGSRGQVVGLAMAESLLLALFGGLAALAVSVWGGSLVRATLLPEVEWAGAAGWRLVLFVLLLAGLSGVVAGFLPALQARRSGLTRGLAAGARGASRAGSGVRRVLTVGQAALSVLLLVGAGLFVLSLQQVRALDGGVRPPGLVLVQPVFEPGGDAATRSEFRQRAAERLRALPPVAGATVSTEAPFQSARSMSLQVPGLDSLPTLAGGGPYFNLVDEHYLGVLGHRVVRGRGFTAADAAGAEPVAIVSETTARALWPGDDPIGRCVLVGSADQTRPCRRVVGVIADFARFRVVDEAPALQLILPIAQMPGSAGGLAVRLRDGVDPAAAAALIRREMTALEPALRTVNLVPLTERFARQLRPWELGASLFSLFGFLALLVAAVGLYSVLAFGVAQRTLELGIRAALGASRANLLRLVVREGVLLTGAGLLIGSAAALALAPRIEHLLFEVSPRDPRVLATVGMLLLLVGLAASMIPALRATRVDPAVPLRAE